MVPTYLVSSHRFFLTPPALPIPSLGRAYLDLDLDALVESTLRYFYRGYHACRNGTYSFPKGWCTPVVLYDTTMAGRRCKVN